MYNGDNKFYCPQQQSTKKLFFFKRVGVWWASVYSRLLSLAHSALSSLCPSRTRTLFQQFPPCDHPRMSAHCLPALLCSSLLPRGELLPSRGWSIPLFPPGLQANGASPSHIIPYPLLEHSGCQQCHLTAAAFISAVSGDFKATSTPPLWDANPKGVYILKMLRIKQGSSTYHF